MDKKEAEKKQRSLRNEKLEANRASETEDQRKESLRIRHEKNRARRNKETPSLGWSFVCPIMFQHSILV